MSVLLLVFSIFGLPGFIASVCLASSDENMKYRITAVEVEGVKNVPKNTVLSVIKLRIGDMVTETGLEERLRANELKSIAGMGVFADSAARTIPYKDGIKVIFEVVENALIKEIKIKGSSLITEKEILSLIKVQPRRVLNTNVLQDDLKRIAQRYLQIGRLVKVSKIDIDSSGKLEVSLLERRIESIVILGNKKTHERVIHRELQSQAKEFVSLDTIREDQRRLLSLGFFSEITPTLKEGKTPAGLVYTLNLVERETGEASGGLGYSGHMGVLGYLELVERNVLGRGQSLALRIEMGTRGGRGFEALFLEPWLDSNRTALNVRVFHETTPQTDLLSEVSPEEFLAYIETRRGLELTFDKPIDDVSWVEMRLKAEGISNAADDGLDLGLKGGGHTRSVAWEYHRDTRDDEYSPTSGYTLAMGFEKAGSAFGGTNSFTKLSFNTSLYTKLGKTSIGAARAALGFSFCEGPLPIQERYRIGGADTVRGVPFGSLQGEMMACLNLEARVPLVKNLLGVIFFDIGDAWFQTSAESSESSMKSGIGLGLRLETDIGLLRLEYARGGLSFSIGQAF